MRVKRMCGHSEASSALRMAGQGVQGKISGGQEPKLRQGLLLSISGQHCRLFPWVLQPQGPARMSSRVHQALYFIDYWIVLQSSFYLVA